MIGAVARKLFGSANDRRIRSYRPRVDEINALEAELQKLSDEALRARTDEFKKQVAEGATLDDILVPAFATVREAAKRSLGQRHFDVQLIGGMVLHEGRIAEMKTGEGKTLVATLPVYLNALAGRGVHVVTVNDYLAKRDAEWMAQVYGFLGLTTGVIVHGLDDEQRKKAYDCDVTYGTNNELGFDYLRDNMKYRLEDMVQRGHIFAIVDEVDSILVDEARTPLIISGPLDDRSEFYNTIDTYIPNLAKEDYELDEKQRTVNLTEVGMEKMEQRLRQAGLLKSDSLYDVENVSVVHHVNQALRAHKLFQSDKDYIVRNGEVVIIDEFTGRMMPGRRYSEGLHQALEAKERQPIQPENQTLASITFQNYFRMYEKLGGMTGTASTEADEFQDIYNLEVLEIPTNMPMVRIDDDDEVYRTGIEKYRAVISLIEDCKSRGQPVLVGTTSIEKSEQLAEMLRKEGWEQHDFSDPNAFAALYSGDEGATKAKVFAILNARYHEQEAYIISQAGVPGAITIATNMAGRGTDIQLGGNADMRIRQELPDIADLHERDKSPRAAEIRAQVARLKEKALGRRWPLCARHRAAREPADRQSAARPVRTPGRPRSLEILPVARRRPDAHLRHRQARRHAHQAGLEGKRSDHPSMDQQGAGKSAAESRGAQLRHPQEHPEVRQRDERSAQGDLRSARRMDGRQGDRGNRVRYAPQRDRRSGRQARAGKSLPEQWDTPGLKEELNRVLNLDLPVDAWAKEEGIADEEIFSRVERRADEHMAAKVAQWGADVMRYVEKSILLQTLDHLWREHLVMLDHLRQVIGLRGYGQRDPLNEYKAEAFNLFEAMSQSLREAVTGQLMRVEIQSAPPPQPAPLPAMEAHKADPLTGEDEMALAAAGAQTLARHGIGSAAGVAVGTVEAPVRNPKDPTSWGKVGRNEFLSLRLRQEIQTLPRQIRLSGTYA